MRSAVSAMKRTSTSLVLSSSVSICQRGLMCQLKTSRLGGSNARTRAHWHSLPTKTRNARSSGASTTIESWIAVLSAWMLYAIRIFVRT